MQETRNNCFGSKKFCTTLHLAKTGKHECWNTLLCVAVTFPHSCLFVFAWRRVVLHFFHQKQLLQVSCILWCYFQSDFQPNFCSSTIISYGFVLPLLIFYNESRVVKKSMIESGPVFFNFGNRRIEDDAWCSIG